MRWLCCTKDICWPKVISPRLKRRVFLFLHLIHFAKSLSETGSPKSKKNPEVKDKVMPALTQDKELQISDEDRIIDGVTFKIYWDYFKSGLNAITIVGVIFLCFITQGKLDRFSLCFWRRPSFKFQFLASLVDWGFIKTGYVYVLSHSVFQSKNSNPQLLLPYRWSKCWFYGEVCGSSQTLAMSL